MHTTVARAFHKGESYWTGPGVVFLSLRCHCVNYFDSVEIAGEMVKACASAAEVDALLAMDGLVVIDFYADWCGPCRFIAPKVEEFSKEVPSVHFGKINVDTIKHKEVSTIQAMPTFRLYKNGKQVAEVVGADINGLIAAVKKNM